jgi:hypothetical protein
MFNAIFVNAIQGLHRAKKGEYLSMASRAAG